MIAHSGAGEDENYLNVSRQAVNASVAGVFRDGALGGYVKFISREIE